jgi:hypothetical protein
MSAFSTACDVLVAAGVSVVPIKPGAKFPGAFSSGKWHRMKDWSRFCSHIAPPNVIDQWKLWPDAGIGIALGVGSGLAVVDIDLPEDSWEFSMVFDVCPVTPCAKKGQKGVSLFYRHNPEVSSKKILMPDKTTAVDLLCTGRQTVIPPTIHPDTGLAYEWLGDPLNECIQELPMLPADIEQRIREALGLPMEPEKHQQPSTTPPSQQEPCSAPGDWRELNEAALSNLDRWVPSLIPDAIHERDGYRCAAYWRGGDGLNVGIRPKGIRDFARDQGMTPLDLVVAVRDGTIAAAREWLEEALGVREEIPAFIMEFIRNPKTGGGAHTNGNGAHHLNGHHHAPPENLHPWERQITGITEARQWRDPLPYLVDGLVPCGRIGVVSGAPGSLKSMILMHMGCCVAGGLSWLNHDVAQSPVLWYNADSPTDAIQDRLGALANGLSLEGAEEFHLLSFPTPGLDLSSDAQVGGAISFIKKRGIRLFFVDALQRVKGGANENDATEMAKVMDGARRIVEKTGCTILFIHHVTKEQTGKASVYRGSSAILDALDFALSVEREGETITLKPVKEREAPIESLSARFSFAHHPGTRKLMSASFTNGDIASGVKNAFEKLKDSIADYIASQPEPGPTLVEIREAVTGKVKTIGTAVEELIEEGRIRKVPGNGRKITYARCSHVPDVFPICSHLGEHNVPGGVYNHRLYPRGTCSKGPISGVYVPAGGNMMHWQDRDEDWHTPEGED